RPVKTWTCAALTCLLASGAGCAPRTRVSGPVAATTETRALSISRDACLTVVPMLRRELTHVQDRASRMQHSMTLAGSLSALHAVEDASGATTRDLKDARFTDGDNTHDAGLAVRELSAANEGLARVRSRIETMVHETAEPLRAAREKAWELRTVCEAARKPS